MAPSPSPTIRCSRRSKQLSRPIRSQRATKAATLTCAVADFFDVDNHKQWTLVSTGIEPAGGDFVLHTNLTIKGVTKPVDFALEFEGVVIDPWGNTKAGFSAEAEINRKDFGLEWNVALEAGGVVVGEKVKIVLEIEAVKS